jgi:predicted SAM-dependent methyltransferase
MGDKKKVILGGWDRKYPSDWINVDILDHPNVNIVSDMRKLPFEDNSVDVLYSSNSLEYFDREETIEALKEWKRVLKPNGELFIAVPDFEMMAKYYIQFRVPLMRFIGPLYGKMDINGKNIYHKQVFDYSSLGELLFTLGFKRIEKYDCQDLDLFNDEAFDDHSLARVDSVPIILKIRCKK